MQQKERLRSDVRFLLILSMLGAVAYYFFYLKSFAGHGMYARDFEGVFYLIAGKISWPLPLAEIYDLAQSKAKLAGESTTYAPYMYLPHFLPVLWPLKGAPMIEGYGLWIMVQWLLYAGVVWWMRPWMIAGEVATFEQKSGFHWPVVILLCAIPHVLHMQVVGHPSLLVALCAYVGFMQVERRPILAGVLFALASYKPQMSMMLPVFLLAGRYWPALTAYIVTGGLLVVFALATFGFEFFPHFLSMVQLHSQIVLMASDDVHKQAMGVYAVTVLAGGGNALAGWLQMLSMVAAYGALIYTSYRRQLLPAMVILLLVPFLSSPYVMLYDSVMLAPAIAGLLVLEATYKPLLLRRIAVLSALLLPLLVVGFQTQDIPIVPIVLVLMLASALWRPARTV
jgi:hypothetical protein